MRAGFYGLVCLALFAGCAGSAPRVDVSEWGTSRPYTSLGILEVKTKTGLWCKDSDHRDDIHRELAKEARYQYGADAVINVRYWPGSAESDLGYFYGRGEMIRYIRFPAPQKA